MAIQVRGLGGRPKRDAIRAVIRDLCAWRPLSGDELATLLARTRVHLVNEHLSPMITAGLLVRTIPGQPNHPQQKYRVSVPPEGKP